MKKYYEFTYDVWYCEECRDGHDWSIVLAIPADDEPDEYEFISYHELTRAHSPTDCELISIKETKPTTWAKDVR